MPCCALADWMAMKSDGWVPARDVRNYADGQLTVTITLAEYRELVAYRAMREAMDGDGGDDDDADRS